MLQAQHVLFHVFVENSCLCAENQKSILPGCHKPFQGKKSGGTDVRKTRVTLLAMCLGQRMTKIQVFLVTPLCQHFLVAIVMGLSFLET